MSSSGRDARGALGALGSLAPNYYLVDGVVPRTQLAPVLTQVAEVGRKHGVSIANVFHAGDGNLHPCLLFDEREPGALEKDNNSGRRGAGGLRRCRRYADRGARCWPRKERTDALGVHARGHGCDAPCSGGLCPCEQHKPRQDIPRRASSSRCRPSSGPRHVRLGQPIARPSGRRREYNGKQGSNYL